MVVKNGGNNKKPSKNASSIKNLTSLLPNYHVQKI